MKKMNTQFLTPTEHWQIWPMSTMTSIKKTLKEEIMNEHIETLMEKLQEIVKQNIQDQLK
jgi:hypothetical protein